MRICSPHCGIAPESGSGGEVYERDLLKGLAALGEECHVLLARGTYAAGGSDSSCYALMADAFASGRLQPSSALEPEVPWPDAAKTFAPGGFVPSQSAGAAAAPVCAPGFSLLLAPLLKMGGANALFAIAPPDDEVSHA